MLTVQRALHRAIPLHNTTSRGCCAVLTLLSALGLGLCAVATHQKLAWRAYAWAGYGGLLIAGCTILHCLRPTAQQVAPPPPQSPILRPVVAAQPAVDEDGFAIIPGYDSKAFQVDLDLLRRRPEPDGTLEWEEAAGRVAVETHRRGAAYNAYCRRVMEGDRTAVYPHAMRTADHSPMELENAGISISRLQALFKGQSLELLSTQDVAEHIQVTADQLIQRIDDALSRNQSVLLNGAPDGARQPLYMPIYMTYTTQGIGQPNVAFVVCRMLRMCRSIQLSTYQGTVVICPSPSAAPAAPPPPAPATLMETPQGAS
jgi:hypothetical protein